jgi:hypothetical protein
MARPTRLNAKLQRAICLRIERGNYPEVSAAAEGIPERTFREWMKNGRQGLQPYERFVIAVDRARARAEADLVEVIRKGDTKNRKMSRAAGWLLERTRSKRFGAVIRHRVEDELERLLDIVQAVCSESDFRRVLEAIAARDREEETGEPAGPGHEAVH